MITGIRVHLARNRRSWCRNRCSPSVESAFTFDRNRRSRWAGIRTTNPDGTPVHLVPCRFHVSFQRRVIRLRLERELDASRLWVNAYTNNVSFYVASQRMIPEGGYEVDRSMVYYGHPAPFASQTEDTNIRAVLALFPPASHASDVQSRLPIKWLPFTPGAAQTRRDRGYEGKQQPEFGRVVVSSRRRECRRRPVGTFHRTG